MVISVSNTYRCFAINIRLFTFYAYRFNDLAYHNDIHLIFFLDSLTLEFSALKITAFSLKY